jgi:hypothetical protein
MLAVHIADRGADVMAVPDRPEIVTPFLSTLDKLLTYDGDHTQDQVAPVLVDCLVQRRVRQDSSSDRPPTYSTDPRPRPTPPDDRDQRWSTAAAGRAIAVAAVALLVGVLVGALGTRPWRHDDQVTTSSATVTPTTITTTLTAAPSPPGPEAALSGAPTLDHVSIQLLAHPKGSQIDPAVIAVPEHSTHARATMAMGGVLDVEIQLALRTGVTPDPDEHFYIGLWPSGLMTLQPNTTTVSQPNVPSTRINDLKPTPTTAVTDLDPHGAPTKYTLNVAAVPQPAVTGASPGSGYFCGYNTQAVNAILVSSKHSATQILTTLPVSVLRTTDCG